MKNEKLQYFWGSQSFRGVFTKNQYIYIYIYIGGLPKKGRLGNFADLGGKGRLGKKEQGVFLRGEGAGWYPNPYYELH